MATSCGFVNLIKLPDYSTTTSSYVSTAKRSLYCSQSSTSVSRILKIQNGQLRVSASLVSADQISDNGTLTWSEARPAYPPCIWDYDYLELMADHNSNKDSSVYQERVEKLKEEVKLRLFNNADLTKPLALLEIIEDIDRLGLGYHFEMEIRNWLDKISVINCEYGDSLHATALRFRILRNYGYKISQDVFNRFKDAEGSFKLSLCEDLKGFLSLYEASFLGMEGEETLDSANTFCKAHMNKLKEQSIVIGDNVMTREISHASEIPRHWRINIAEARWYIDSCEMKDSYILPELLQLAKLEFNSIQVLYQEEIAELIRWWKDLGLKDNLEFIRDRLMESFLWGLGTTSDRKYSKSRIATAKVVALITTIDDVYDVYASFDELKTFTEAVNRWDISVSEPLPTNLRVCLMALFNTINDMAYHILKEHGFDSLPYFKKSWADICNAYMAEAKIVKCGKTQILEEYMNNAWVAIGVCVILSHSFPSTKQCCSLSKENLEYIFSSDISKWSSMNLRYVDDLATSKAEVARGDIFKAVQWYELEAEVSEEEAREYITTQVGETWKLMNTIWLGDSDLPPTFVMFAMNIARASHYIYQCGDGHGAPDEEDRTRLMSLVVQPFLV